MKRKIRKGRVFFITLIVVALLSMPTIVMNEMTRRGYFAIGGEWLIVPLICMVWVAEEMVRDLLHIMKKRRTK